jgi:hypothetical protein
VPSLAAHPPPEGPWDTPSQRSSDGSGILRKPLFTRPDDAYTWTLATGQLVCWNAAMTHFGRRFDLRLGLWVLLMVGLQACRTTQPPAPSTPVPDASEATVPPSRPVMPPDAPLAAEARWLAELFAGTPVQVSGERDGSVRLAVPMKYAFDAPAAAAPKPPLQAVLDKLSQSLKRQPAARLQAAPPAGKGSAERLAAIRSHLAGRGVPNWRVAAAAPAEADQVLLRLVSPAGGVRKLDDSTLPPPPPPPASAGRNAGAASGAAR